MNFKMLICDKCSCKITKELFFDVINPLLPSLSSLSSPTEEEVCFLGEEEVKQMKEKKKEGEANEGNEGNEDVFDMERIIKYIIFIK
jgi:hypothetical protein